MTGARKFLFDRDFRDPGSGSVRAVLEAEERGYARGLADGRSIADKAIEARLADSVGQLAALAETLLARDGERVAQSEREAADFALAFARKLAGAALAQSPLVALAEAAGDCFRHLRGVPHLVVRINDALADPADALMKQLAHERGFEGRVVVVGERDIMPGDARLEWADGGIKREIAAIEGAIAAAIAATLGGTT